MNHSIRTSHLLGVLVILSVGATARADGGDGGDRLQDAYDDSLVFTDEITFPQLVVGDPVLGQKLFGVKPDDLTIDTSGALFNGTSVISGPVVSNGTACSTCHQPVHHFLLPPSPISNTIPLTDPFFTNRTAENGADPLGPSMLDQLGLVQQRVNRFNPTISESNPCRRVFSWRKTQTILNMAFGFGFLADGRAREGLEQARGATFTHTQNSDNRFDDLVNPSLPHIVAYMQTEIDPPELKALLNPNDPNYPVLTQNPYITVNATTDLELQGQDVFNKNCFGCHNMPNVFGNRAHRNCKPLDQPPLYGHTMDIGVAQRNANNLEFRVYDPSTGTRSAVVLPLVKADGTVVSYTVTDDIGAAAITARYEDLHRFKVPQLRRISQLGPYFHDNSAKTLEDVVDYFNSDDYNDSKDGRKYPIHLSKEDRAALLAFLNIL